MKKTVFLFLLMSFVTFSQVNKIVNGTLIVKDSVFVEGSDKKKLIEYPSENVKILISCDLCQKGYKIIARSNPIGKFTLKLNSDDFNKNKKIVFQSATINELVIDLDSLKSDSTIFLKKGNSYYTVGKPAIYLYPEKVTDVFVKLNFKGIIGTTYPNYENGWNLIANPNGVLENKKDNRKYNYLFWDGIYNFPEKHFDYNDGFIVKKDELVTFFTNTLSKIGLNETETNDFIVYWLPQLNKNETNFIHFWINDNIDNSSFLDVFPKPDSEIIVYFEFKKVSNSFKIKEQILPNIKRKGFVLVEWGGCNLADKKIE